MRRRRCAPDANAPGPRTVVAVGSGEMTLKEAGRVAFSFTDDRISRLETFHINLGGPGDTLFTTSTG